MADFTACPQSTLDGLDKELRIIRMGAAIRGFTSPKDCIAKALRAGFTVVDTCHHDFAEALRRELHRQRQEGERAKIVTVYDPPPIPLRDYDWHATFEDFDPERGWPIGRGATEFQAVLDLVHNMDAHDVAA